MSKITPFDISEKTDLSEFQTQVRKAFESLFDILTSVSPKDNFKSFVWEGSVSASSEKKIRNPLGRVPFGYLIVFASGGLVQAGTTAWTTEYVYLKEILGTTTSVKVVFFM